MDGASTYFVIASGVCLLGCFVGAALMTDPRWRWLNPKDNGDWGLTAFWVVAAAVLWPLAAIVLILLGIGMAVYLLMRKIAAELVRNREDH